MHHQVNVKFKKLVPEAVVPTFGREGDVGADLVCTSLHFDEHGAAVYGTGIAIELPEGYYADLRARSSVSKYDLVIANGLGTIDPNYRGELIFKFKPCAAFYDHPDNPLKGTKTEPTDLVALFEDIEDATLYEIGDKIGQLVILPYPKINFIEVQELSDSNRGANGFGSSGK